MNAAVIAAAAAAMIGMLAGTEVYAQTMTYGQGKSSCGEYVAASETSRMGKQQRISPYIDWIAGYATLASIQNGIDYFKGTDAKSIQLWLENYCRANPLENFTDAAVQMMKELHGKQME